MLASSRKETVSLGAFVSVKFYLYIYGNRPSVQKKKEEKISDSVKFKLRQ